MIYCDLLILDIENASKDIKWYDFKNYQNSFRKKYDNIFLAFKDAKQNDKLSTFPNFSSIIRESIQTNLSFFSRDIFQLMIIFF